MQRRQQQQRRRCCRGLHEMATIHWKRNLTTTTTTTTAVTTARAAPTTPRPPPAFLQTSTQTREIWKGIISNKEGTPSSPLSMFLGHENTILLNIISYLNLPLDPCSCCRLNESPIIVYCCRLHKRFVVTEKDLLPAREESSSVGEAPDSLLIQIHKDPNDEILSYAEYLNGTASIYSGHAGK